MSRAVLAAVSWFIFGAVLGFIFGLSVATSRPAAQVTPSGTPGVSRTEPVLRTGAPHVRGGVDPSDGIHDEPSSEVSPDQPSMTGGASPTPRPTGGIGTAASYCRQFCDTPKPLTRTVNGAGITGTSTWYQYVYGGAAAAKMLRDWLGPDWRGTRVQVCNRDSCVVVVLLDYESSTIPGRLIDLDSRMFAQLAPLSWGAIDVTVRRVP